MRPLFYVGFWYNAGSEIYTCYQKSPWLQRERTGRKISSQSFLSLWFNREGKPLGDFGPQGRYWTLGLSPDGLRAAVNPDGNLWILDAGRCTRLTSGPADAHNAVWSKDGSEVVFVSGFSRLLIKQATPGSQETELLNAG
jgi:hypothetical protein